jgi:hypothetical protein
MRSSSVPARPVARFPRRPRPLLVTAAVTLPALSACGTERTGVDKPDDGSAHSAGAAAPDVAFTEMLDQVAPQCPPSAPPEAPPSGPAEAPRTGPAHTLPT